MNRVIPGRELFYASYNSIGNDDLTDDDVAPAPDVGLADLFRYLGLTGTDAVVVDPMRTASPTLAAACTTANLHLIVCSSFINTPGPSDTAADPAAVDDGHNDAAAADDDGAGPLLPTQRILRCVPAPQWLVVLAHAQTVVAHAVDLYLPHVSGGLIVQADDLVTDMAADELPPALQRNLPDANVTTRDCGTHLTTQVWLVWANDPALVARMAVNVQLF